MSAHGFAHDEAVDAARELTRWVPVENPQQVLSAAMRNIAMIALHGDAADCAIAAARLVEIANALVDGDRS